MIATIGIEKLSVMSLIGVFAHERVGAQELFIDLKAEFDVSKCVLSDSVSDALNYDLLADRCREIAEKTSFNLIESFASAIIENLSVEFPISHIWVRVSKPKALKNAIFAFVEMEKRI